VGSIEQFEYRPPAVMARGEVQRSWVVGIQIASIGLNTRQVYPGGVVLLDLEFSTIKPLKQNYTLYVHLVPVKGAVIAERDCEPQYGGRPTTSWAPALAMLERRAVRITLDAASGVYKVVCGWFTPSGNRLLPAAGQGEIVDGGIVLGTIEVLAK
jgi:hypothetical protein